MKFLAWDFVFLLKAVKRFNLVNSIDKMRKTACVSAIIFTS